MDCHLATGSVTGFSQTGIGNPIHELLINTGTFPGVVAYRVVAALNNCLSDSVLFYVTVNLPHLRTLTYSSVICLGETTFFRMHRYPMHRVSFPGNGI